MKKTILIGSFIVLEAGQAFACGGFSANPNDFVRFTGQNNIVIWDDKRHIEHFIREASFSSSNTQFDFVAPTPAVPQIEKAKKAAFQQLWKLTPLPQYSFGNRGGAGGWAIQSKVEVAQVVEVGNMRATTLRASDTKALKEWLRVNGYTVSNTQDEWFKHYIDKDWYLTAFRVISKDPTLKTEALRMSFPTKQPYNPYYVPKDNWSKGATLSLFFISTQEMTGYIGNKRRWSAPPLTTVDLPADQYDQLAKNVGLKASDIPKNALVTRYMDYGFAQGATDDLFFR